MCEGCAVPADREVPYAQFIVDWFPDGIAEEESIYRRVDMELAGEWRGDITIAVIERWVGYLPADNFAASFGDLYDHAKLDIQPGWDFIGELD